MARQITDTNGTVHQLDPGQVIGLDVMPLADGVMITNPASTFVVGDNGQPSDTVLFDEFEYDSFHITKDMKKRDYYMVPGSDQHHFLSGGECFYFTDNPAYVTPPSEAKINAIKYSISNELDMDCFAHDRFNETLAQFGDIGIGAVERDWHRYFGGPPLEPWYENVCTHADGYDNWHYDTLLWELLNYIETRKVEDWALLITHAIAHAQYGIIWSKSSNHWGMPRYEKSGSDPVVGGKNRASHAKKWLRGLASVAFMTGHPLLIAAVKLRIERLIADIDKDVWQFSWGARIAARDLDDKYVAAKFDPAQAATIKAGVEKNIRKWIAGVDSRGYWVNRGSNKTTSPWMNGELVAAIGRWMEWGVAEDLKGDLLNIGAAIWNNGTDPTNDPDIKSVRYRFFGSEASKGHLSLIGYMIPMLRWMAKNDAFWYDTYINHRNFQLENMGNAWRSVGRTGPVTYRYAPGGSGHHKALKQSLGCCLK